MQRKRSSATPEVVEAISQISEIFPQDEASQEAILTWAYNEALLLLRQYGDLLELTRSYLLTGSSTPGETALMLEEELQ